jgi:hypothetical protein
VGVKSNILELVFSFCIWSSLLWLTTCLQHRRSKDSQSFTKSSVHCLRFSFLNSVFFLIFGFSQFLHISMKAALLGVALTSSGNLSNCSNPPFPSSGFPSLLSLLPLLYGDPPHTFFSLLSVVEP